MKKFLKEFKEFAVKGNMIDLAVGVIVGGAFGKIVTSLVNDIIMPVLTLLTGGVNVSGLFVQLSGDTRFASVEAAKEAGVSTLNYGLFLQNIIDFVIIALCIFVVLKGIMALKKKPEEAPKEEPRLCPFCKMEVHKEATRCPHCTSELE